MSWPKLLIFQFKSKCSDKILSQLIVFITIEAVNKNSYSMGPFLTDTFGKISIKKKDIEKHIDSYQIDFPMDYMDDLKECVGITIIVEDLHGLKERVNRAIKYYPEAAKKLEEMIIKSRNSEVLLFKETFKKELIEKQSFIELNL